MQGYLAEEGWKTRVSVTCNSCYYTNLWSKMIAVGEITQELYANTIVYKDMQSLLSIVNAVTNVGR